MRSLSTARLISIAYEDEAGPVEWVAVFVRPQQLQRRFTQRFRFARLHSSSLHSRSKVPVKVNHQLSRAL